MTKPAAQLNAKSRRRVLEFAERVALLAAEAPNEDTKKAVYTAVNKMRRQYGFSKEEKRAEIFRQIGIGAATVADIIRETKYHADDVHEITRELEVEGLVVFRRMQNIGVGRPTVCIFLKNE